MLRVSGSTPGAIKIPGVWPWARTIFHFTWYDASSSDGRLASVRRLHQIRRRITLQRKPRHRHRPLGAPRDKNQRNIRRACDRTGSPVPGSAGRTTCLPKRRGCSRNSGRSGPGERPRAAEGRSNASSRHRICRNGAAEQSRQVPWSTRHPHWSEGGHDSIMRPCRPRLAVNTAHPVVLRECPTREARR